MKATPAAPLLIAEIGVNHDGDPKQAAAMVESCAEAGFDAVKFQYWLVDELLAPEAPNAAYQGPGDQRDLLAGLSLGLGDLVALRQLSRDLGLLFIVTPDGRRACRDIVGIGPDVLKIGSGDADNPWLLEAVAASGLPVIASTGMMTDDEVTTLTDRLRAVDDVILLHCVSAYPTPLEHANLRRLPRLAGLGGRPVGLSDHTIGVAAAAAALALGAVAVEKHVTWWTGAAGPDHAMSLPLTEADAWVKTLRALARGLHDPAASPDEIANRAAVRKALYTRRALAAGDVVALEDMEPLRPLGDGIAVGRAGDAVGRTVARPVQRGRRLSWRDLEP
ncbi:MAG: N,N-diacetyllegionaminate synthase [Acidimicrobiaceae bacterium]|nr:N,N-diacetyllegionaminate synthase [Acidimicrobiaceae bacterium]